MLPTARGSQLPAIQTVSTAPTMSHLLDSGKAHLVSILHILINAGYGVAVLSLFVYFVLLLDGPTH